jgi:hypothetical protein
MCVLQEIDVLTERPVLRALRLSSKDGKDHVYKDTSGCETAVSKLW